MRGYGLAISCSFFKVQLIVPLLVVLIFERKIMPFISLIVSQLIAFVFSLFWFKDFYGLTFAKIVGLKGFNSGASKFIDLSVMIPNTILMYGVTLLVIIFIVYISLKMENKDFSLYFAFVLLCSLILCYHRIYDYFMFIIPLGYLYDNYKNEKRGIAIVVLLFGIASVGLMNYGVTVNENLSIIMLRFTYYMVLLYLGCECVKKLNEKNEEGKNRNR